MAGTAPSRPQTPDNRSQMAAAVNSSDGRSDIELILSGGRSLRRSVRPNDTLGALVNDLRINGHLMGVSAIRVGSGDSLLTRGAWRHLTMAQIGVESGEALHITTFRPAALRVAKFRPEQRQPMSCRTVPIAESEDASLAAIETKLRQLSFDPMEETAITYQNLTTYERAGKKRRAIYSFDERNDRICFVDEVTGIEEIADQRKQLTVAFLSSGSGPIAAASSFYVPVLSVDLSSEVLTIDGQGELQPAFKTSVLFPNELMFMRGLRQRDRNGATLTIMLWLCDGEYVNVKSGHVYRDEDEAVASVPEVNGIWSRVLIFVGPSSRLPRYKIPGGKMVAAYMRSGWEVNVIERQVKGQPTDREDSGSVWMTPSDASGFHLQLTRVMRL